MDGYPDVRLRRLRRTAAVRDLFAMPKPGPEKFIWPVFVVPGTGRREPIASMPGQFRLSADELVKELAPVVAQGVTMPKRSRPDSLPSFVDSDMYLVEPATSA